jgi:pyruvate/2-oxoglutarate dehydrogenase complex dihydrolipoamide acyltransferase (E2) component
MCFDPGTLSILSTVVGATGAVQQGNAQAAAYNAQAAADTQNAQIASRQAEEAAVSGAREEQEMRRRGQAFAASQRAAFSVNGLDIAAGSPADVLTDTVYQNELDALNIRRNTANKVWGYQAQETNYNNSASANRAAASNARKAGNLSAFGTLLTGTTSYMDKYKKTSSSDNSKYTFNNPLDKYK